MSVDAFETEAPFFSPPIDRRDDDRASAMPSSIMRPLQPSRQTTKAERALIRIRRHYSSSGGFVQRLHDDRAGMTEERIDGAEGRRLVRAMSRTHQRGLSETFGGRNSACGPPFDSLAHSGFAGLFWIIEDSRRAHRPAANIPSRRRAPSARCPAGDQRRAPRPTGHQGRGFRMAPPHGCHRRPFPFGLVLYTFGGLGHEFHPGLAGPE